MNQIDSEQAFRLVDSILPFEACLYHQILPLSLEGSRLRLGMVNTDDSAALDYVRRILAYMNCSLVPQPLSSEVHYAALSAYLSYADRQKKAVDASAPPVARRIAKKLAEQSVKRTAESRSPDPKDDKDPHTYPTLVVDSPTELPGLRVEAVANPKPDPPPAKLPVPVELVTPQPASPLQVPSTAANELDTDAPTALDINPLHLTDPLESLLTLTPTALMEELLGRILTWGIGRLYLERHPYHGRILWSQNGALQAVLDTIALDTFEEVIQELKGLAQLAIGTVQKPRTVEAERIYQNQRVLLRLRVMPGKHGEEATLQVLRGAALKFYQQQQLVNLGQEALAIAQQLQTKMGEIYARSKSRAIALPEHLHILPELDQSLHRLRQQLGQLQALQSDADEDESS